MLAIDRYDYDVLRGMYVCSIDLVADSEGQAELDCFLDRRPDNSGQTSDGDCGGEMTEDELLFWMQDPGKAGEDPIDYELPSHLGFGLDGKSLNSFGYERSGPYIFRRL